MSAIHTEKVRTAIEKHGENSHFEFRGRAAADWHRSPHLPRPRAEAEAFVARANAEDKSIVYRCIPWDGE